MSSPELTTVSVRPETRDRIRRRKEGGQTYDELLNRMLEETEDSAPI